MKAIDVKASRSGKPRVWDRESVLEQIHLLKGEEILKVAEDLILWCERNEFTVQYGGGQREGSAKLGFTSDSNDFYKLFDIGAGRLWVPFDFIKTYLPFDQIEYRKELLKRLISIKGFSIKEDKLDTWTALNLNGLSDRNEFDKFCAIFEWLYHEIQQYSKK